MILTVAGMSFVPSAAVGHESSTTQSEPTQPETQQPAQPKVQQPELTQQPAQPGTQPSQFQSRAPQQLIRSDLDCREMTDSIVRLYLAYFDREPGEELKTLISEYQTGQTSLELISQEFSETKEFADRAGNLSNAEFVDFVYSNIAQQDPEPSDRNHWLQSLESDYPRGTMMLAFSESELFVNHTSTVKPLAGFLRWYPKGVHWYCGRGTSKFQINALTGTKVSSDFLFDNGGKRPSDTSMWVLEKNFTRNIQMTKGVIPPGYTDYNWDGVFTGDGNYGSNVEVRSGADTRWIIAFYPHSIGGERLGWQVQR